MLKNCHLLRFADLAYGIESNQFKRIEKKTVKYNPIVPNAVTGKDYAAACGFVKKKAKNQKIKKIKRSFA